MPGGGQREQGDSRYLFGWLVPKIAYLSRRLGGGRERERKLLRYWGLVILTSTLRICPFYELTDVAKMTLCEFWLR